MSDWPSAGLVPLTITPWSLEAAMVPLLSNSLVMGGAASAVYPTANRALFVPFHLSMPCIAVKMFWYNGATASGNVDAGIYDGKGTLIVSAGSTAQGTISVIQEVDITDTLLGPGLFYLAIVLDNITGTLLRSAPGTGGQALLIGMSQMSTAFALPATATFETLTENYLPIFGFTTRAVI